MHYITLDLEWNQAYQEKAMAVQKRLACRLRGEVIQIGAVKLDEKGELCGSYSITVKPTFYKRILRHVAKLTGITQERADRGVSLKEAAESFRRFCGEDFVLLTWGPDDIPMLLDNFRVHKINGDWIRRVYDLQPIFNQQTTKAKNQPSLEFAMEYFQIVQNLPAHDALNDAYFTALVAQKLDLARGIAEYRVGKKENLLDEEIGNADIGDVGFADISDLLGDKHLTHPVCPLCGEALEPGTVLHLRNQRYSFLTTCQNHGKLFFHLKASRNFNETFRGHLWVVAATEEAIALHQERLKEKAEASHRRRRRRRSAPSEKLASESGNAPTKEQPAE